jgi:aryl carrier-like protein
MNTRTIIEQQFAETLQEAGAAVPARFADDLVLLQSGLDSLGFAVLITRLETACGYDPFTLMTEPFYPRTFGELVEVYDRFKAHAA